MTDLILTELTLLSLSQLTLIIILTFFISWVLRSLETGLTMTFIMTLVMSMVILYLTDSLILTLLSWVLTGLISLSDNISSRSI